VGGGGARRGPCGRSVLYANDGLNPPWCRRLLATGRPGAEGGRQRLGGHPMPVGRDFWEWGGPLSGIFLTLGVLLRDPHRALFGGQGQTGPRPEGGPMIAGTRGWE